MQIIRDRRWKEVTAVFNFPSTATNASFVLRKYYHSLLLHYEQIYYFKALAWDPLASGVLVEHLDLVRVKEFGTVNFPNATIILQKVRAALL